MPLNSAGATLVSGMIAQSHNQDILANNLANVDTVGFKRDEVAFKTVLDETKAVKDISFDPRKSLTDEVYYGHYPIDIPVKLDSDYTHHTQGNVIQTNSPLDIAVEEDTFIAVETEFGERYTKSGNLVFTNDGHLVTPEGYRVLGAIATNVPIQTVGESVRILDSGEVESDGIIIDKIKMVTADDLQKFVKEGHTFYRFEGAPEELRKIDDPEVLSGYIEKSNVNAMTELNSMTLNLRLFEAETAALKSVGRTIERAINVVGRV